MVFWIIAAIIAFIATLSVVLPLAGSKGELVSDLQHDKALYKSRIEEFERDLKFGNISQEQAEAAKAEEGRKLIAIAKSDEASSAHSGKARSVIFYRLLQGACFVFIPVITIAVYLYVGNPNMPDQSLLSRISADPSGQPLEENVARVEAHLAKFPNDASGWAVLAPVYYRMERYPETVNAWSRVLQLNPKFPEVRSLLAEAILNTTGGVVTKQARDLFLSELQTNPASARSRYYLALALSQEGQYEKAAKAWQLLIDGTNPQAPWFETAKQLRDEAIEGAKLKTTPLAKPPSSTSPNLPGPTVQQVEDATKLNSKDRASMIQSMVAGLAERLKDDPSDKEGWLRLIRAYNVLGKKEDALSAINQAKKTHTEDSSFISSLSKIQKTISN